MRPAGEDRRKFERGTHSAEKESPRNALLVRGIEKLRSFAQLSAQKERASTLYAMYVLRRMIRNSELPLHDAVRYFTMHSADTELSSELRQLYSNLALEFAEEAAANLAIPASSFPDFAPMLPVDVSPRSALAIFPAKVALSTASIPRGADVKASTDIDRIRNVDLGDFDGIFRRAADYANNHRYSLPGNPVKLAGLIDDTVSALVDVEVLLQQEFGFRVACIRGTPTGAFEQEYAAALARARASESGDALHRVEEFAAGVREYIGIRARVAVMLRCEQALFRETQAAKPLSPFAVLGVAETASVEEVEAAYLARLHAIDPDVVENTEAIAMLHAARTQALEMLEKVDDEATQPLPLVPLSSLDKSPSGGTVVETPVKVSEVAFSHPVPQSALEPAPERESWLIRRLRTPGAKLRMLLFGAGAAMGVAGAMVKSHVVEGYAPEPTHERAEELQGEEGVRTFAERAVDAMSSPKDAAPRPEDGPEATPTPEIPSSYHVVSHRETLWQILGDKIRARGLPVTNAKILMLKHLADTDNPGVYWENLQPGQVIQLESVDTMLDAMEGKGGGASGETEGAVGEGAELKDALAEKTVSGDGVDSGVQEGMTVAPKAYESLPTAGETMHRMVKGENVYTLVHQMLRSRGLNWTTERINFLTQLVVDKNADLFRTMVQDGRMRFMHEESIPEGAVLDFSDAVQVIDEMGRAKQEGKKAKTVRELARAHGYGYPIMMKFPTS